MSMTIKDLFKISLFKNAELIAGKKGISNEITWFNLMEIIDVVSSMEHGEFLITTGYRLDDIEFSKNLIFKLKERGVSGLGIQPGYYIDKIPDHLIEESNDADFPLLLIPKKITFSMITRTLYKELVKYGDEDDRNRSLQHKNIILDILEKNSISKNEENYLNKIFMSGEGHSSYMMNVNIGHKYDGVILRTDIEESLNKICSVLERHNCTYHSEFIRGDKIIFFSISESVLYHEVYNELEQTLIQLASGYNNLNYYIGISGRINSISELYKAYEESLALQRKLKKIESVKGIFRYEDIEIVSLFEDSASRKNIIRFSSLLLDEIIDHDRANDSSYFETLRIYLTNNCNSKRTSELLYIHRHTLTYRLEKMSRLFNIDFMNYQSLMKYNLAIITYNLYNR